MTPPAANTISANATNPHAVTEGTEGLETLASTLPLSPAKFVGELAPVLRSKLSELIPSVGSAPAKKLNVS